jgi:hypothetical protein
MRKQGSATRFRRSDGEAPHEAGGTTPSPRSLLLLAAAFVLLILWLVIRVSIANALLGFRPELAAALSPDHPLAVLALVGNDQQAATSSARADAAYGLLERTPLAEEPLLLAARIADQRGETERAVRLLDEVIHRNPRSRTGHLLRLDQQLRQNRVEDATVTIAVLSRLLPASQRLLIEELARMADDPVARGAIARVIETDHRTRTYLLEALARQGADPDTIFSLAGPLEPSAPGDAPRWHTQMLDELVARGQVAQARQAWSRLAGVEHPGHQVYDPDFAGLPGPPPFNWHFHATSEGFAELARGASGLYVEYYGRRDADLGGQLLTLPPGGYRLSFYAEGSADGEGGRIAWTVTCHPDGSTLTRMPITDVKLSSERFSGTFAVPASCPAQWLRLTGTSGEFSKDQRVTIKEFRIAGRGQS